MYLVMAPFVPFHILCLVNWAGKAYNTSEASQNKKF